MVVRSLSPPQYVNMAPAGFAMAPPPIGVVIPKIAGRGIITTSAPVMEDVSNGMAGKVAAEVKPATLTAQQVIDEEAPLSLHHQENVAIKGSSARHLIMQKLIRQGKVGFIFVIFP